MNRHALLLVSVAAVLALLGFILWDVFESAPEGPPSETDTGQISVQQEVSTVSPPLVRRELEVSGRVVGPSLEARAGLRVFCGEESTTTDSNGAFTFPKRLRPRLVTVRVQTGEQGISSWDGVLAGDPLPETDGADTAPGGELPVAAAYDLDAAAVPSLPEKLRWTINTPHGGVLPGGVGADAIKTPPEDQRWIQLDEAVVEEWGNGARARARGRTRLPDGAHVAASLYFDGLRTIATLEPALVKSGTFEVAMYSPVDARFYSGVFELRASFNPVLESYNAIEAWKQSRPDVDWDSLTIPEVTRNVLSGDPVDAREEDVAARAYYVQLCDSARRLERSLKSVLLSRSDERRIFLEGKGLSTKSAQAEPRAWFRADFLDSEGHLDEPKWRKFLDEEWRPELRALAKEHATRGQEKYMTASTLLIGLLDALLDESYGFSRFVVYPAFKLEPHPNDFYVDEERAGDLVRLERVVASSFEGLERFRHLAE